MISHQNLQQTGGMGQIQQMQPSGAGYPQVTPQQQTQNNQGFGGFPPLINSVQSKPDGPSIPARVFVNEQNIRPNEVLNDGTPSLFLQNDYSCIYAEALNRRGTIDIIKYVPERIEDQAVQQVDLTSVMNELKEIKKALYRKNYHKPKNQNPQSEKKE